MNKGIINEELLDKNIKQLEFYSKEEYNLYKKICVQLTNLDNIYNSNNTVKFLKSINSLENKNSTIYEKRKKIISILKRVIIKYNSLSKSTAKDFKIRRINLND